MVTFKCQGEISIDEVHISVALYVKHFFFLMLVKFCSNCTAQL